MHLRTWNTLIQIRCAVKLLLQLLAVKLVFFFFREGYLFTFSARVRSRVQLYSSMIIPGYCGGLVFDLVFYRFTPSHYTSPIKMA